VVNEDQVQENKTKHESSDEVDYYVFLEYSKDELVQALLNCTKCEKKKYLSKIKSLKTIIRD